MSETATDLDTMIPPEDEITVGEKTILLKPVTMRQLQPAIKAALPILQALKSGALDLKKLKSMDMMAWLSAYAEHGSELNEMVAYMIGVTADELADWTPDQVIFSAAKVIKVNTDFFVSLARQLVAAPMQTPPQTGQSSSSDSSEPDTATQQ